MDAGTVTMIEFLLIIIFLPVIAYLLMVIYRKAKMKNVREESNIEDDSYNQLQILESMIKMLSRKGYNTKPVESMLSKARIAYNDRNYAECIEIINSAKRMIMKIDDVTRAQAITEETPSVTEEMKIIKRIEEKAPAKEEMPSQVKDFERKLPENYLQSKFEIGVVEGKIMQREEGEVKQAAIMYLEKAKEFFQNRNYTEALRFAIKSNRILDTNEIPQGIPPQEEKKEIPKRLEIPKTSEAQPEEEEEEELHCPNCGAVVRPGDKYCWNCGAKLIFIYKCPNCGAEVSSEDNFCRNCGYKLK